MTTIAHILGDWSRNIGNAFFQLGGLYALKKSVPDVQISLIGEMPGYPSYWNPRGGNPTNFFDWAEYIDVDYLVLMGPLFRPETEKIWGQGLARIMAKGTKLVLLGVGMMKYDDGYVKTYRELLMRYRPYIFTSRDVETYDKLGDLAEHPYDGIDFGFFVSDLYTPIGLFSDERKWIAFNFDKIPEPCVSLSKTFLSSGQYDFEFAFDDWIWGVRFPRFRQKLAERSRYLMFLEGLFPGNSLTQIGDYEIVRTDHRPHPLLRRKTYRYPRVMVNDVPYAYFEIYKGARLTLSNRVHACVAALAYGNHAMLFTRSPRSRLLERMGLDDIRKHPMAINKDFLEQEKKSLLKFLADVFRRGQG